MTNGRSGRAAILLATAGALVACAPRTAKERTVVPRKPIEEVLAEHRDSLMALPGVVGTAIALCDGAPCIQVMVVDSAARERLRTPERLEGYRVRVEVTGTFRARIDTGGREPPPRRP